MACLIACAPAPEFEPPVFEGEVPRTVLRGVVVDGYRAATREFQVRAASAEVEPALKLVRLQDVRIEFDDERRGVVNVRAERGTLQLDGDDFLLEGGVIGGTGSGERFETEELRYDGARHRLWTDGEVRVERPNMVLTGTGMELDLVARRIRFTGSVEARTVRP
jgi:LPS export ABC transporter protein LptC